MTAGQAFALIVLATIAGHAIYHSGYTLVHYGWRAALLYRRQRQLVRQLDLALARDRSPCSRCWQPLCRHRAIPVRGPGGTAGAIADCPERIHVTMGRN